MSWCKDSSNLRLLITIITKAPTKYYCSGLLQFLKIILKSYDLYLPSQTFLPEILLTRYMIPGNMKKNGPKNPSNATNLLPKNLDIGLLSLSEIRYILGITSKVRKKENISPNMIVQASGPQNTTESPPINIFGSKCVNRDSKSILNPMANGNSPRMVAIAVSNTGMILILPA